MTTNNIRYLYNAETGIELIFCKNSTISYPLHNYVYVLTIGIILDSSVILKTNKETRAYKQNETFAIFPYEPHSILAHEGYSLLTLCIDKNAVNDVDITTIQKHIGFLLMQALNMGKISHYQILQLLNCLDETSDSSNWRLKNHTPYILCSKVNYIIVYSHLKKRTAIPPQIIMIANILIIAHFQTLVLKYRVFQYTVLLIKKQISFYSNSASIISLNKSNIFSQQHIIETLFCLYLSEYHFLPFPTSHFQIIHIPQKHMALHLHWLCHCCP